MILHQKLVIFLFFGIVSVITAAPPEVWKKFNETDPETNRSVEYRIETLENSQYELAAKFITDHILMSMQEINIVIRRPHIGPKWMEFLRENLSVVCYKAGSKNIIGVSVLTIRNTIKPNRKNRFPESVNIQVFEKHEVDKYLSIEGFVVQDEYRCVGEFLLGVNKKICSKQKLKVSAGIFVSGVASELADKIGYTYDREVSYAKLGMVNSYPVSRPLRAMIKSISFKSSVLGKWFGKKPSSPSSSNAK